MSHGASVIEYRSGGFTLVEILVALAIFVTIFAVMSGYLVSAISGQREVLAVRPMVEEISFVAEYLSRALRPAQQSTGACVLLAGTYYELIAPDRIRFIDREGRCREVYVAAGELRETIDGADEGLTSSALDVQSLRFEVSQPPPSETIPHPRVTFTMKVRPRGDSMAQTLYLQTTISQREF